MKRRYYAAIGTDGLRFVVWGVGTTEKAALRDAAYWSDDKYTEENEENEVVEIPKKVYVGIKKENWISWEEIREEFKLPRTFCERQLDAKILRSKLQEYRWQPEIRRSLLEREADLWKIDCEAWLKK